MKFKINEEELKKLQSLVKVSSTVADTSIRDNLYIFGVEGNTLKAVVYGNSNIVESHVSITQVDNEDGNFYLDISKLIQAITNVMMSQSSNEATIEVDTNRLTVSCNKSKVCVGMFDSLDEQEYAEAFSAYDDKKKILFTNPDNTILVKPELMELANSVNKYITMFPSSDVSGILVDGSNFYYSDQSISLVHKPLTYEASKERKVVPQTIFSLLTALSKVEDITVQLSDSDQYMLLDVPSMNYRAIVALPSSVCEYPTEEEYDFIGPDPDNKIEFDIDIPTLLTKISSFDGIFQSSVWKWKQVDFELLAGETSARLYHESAAAELEVDLALQNVVNPNNEDLSFRFSSAMLYDYIKSYVGTDCNAIHVSVSPYEVSRQTPHSYGVEFTADGVEITLCKIMIEDVI